MKIDIHAHFVPRECFGMVDDEGKPFGPTIERDASGQEVMMADGMNLGPIVSMLADPETRIQHMDLTRIDMQAVSVTPTSLFDFLSGQAALRLCRKYNDAIAELVRAYPDRFVGLANLPMQNIALSVVELERAVAELGFRGVQIITNVNGKYLDDPEYLPFFRKVLELDVPIFVHPYRVAGLERMKKYFLSNIVGNPCDTALTIAGLIFSGLLRDFPRLKLAFAHAGGSATLIRGRWDRGYEMVEQCRTIPEHPGHYFKSLYFDTVAHSDTALKYVIDDVGADHVVLGSDYPFVMGDLDPVATVGNSRLISQADKETILARTAAGLLKIPV